MFQIIHMHKTRFFLLAILLSFPPNVEHPGHAQTNSPNYRLNYNKGLLTLSATKANLTTILIHIAEETRILVRFPKDLEKKITIELTGVPLRKALRRILKGENYAIIYKSKKKDISECHILPNQWGDRVPSRTSRSGRRKQQIEASIKRYEKQIERLKEQLLRAKEDSRHGKSILSRIQSYEKQIERLQKNLR